MIHEPSACSSCGSLEPCPCSCENVNPISTAPMGPLSGQAFFFDPSSSNLMLNDPSFLPRSLNDNSIVTSSTFDSNPLSPFSLRQQANQEMPQANAEHNMLDFTFGQVNADFPYGIIYPEHSEDTSLYESDYDLPGLNLLNHLIDIFFDYYPALGRMFEKSPTEMKLALHLPLSHPDRPHPTILHAICGAASIYTDQVPPTRLPFYGRVPSHQLFPDSVKILFDLPDSFGEQHCRIAFKYMHEGSRKDNIRFQVDVIQALIIISTTYRRLAKWGAAYATMDGAILFASLMHLNVGPGFEALTNDYVPSVCAQSALTARQDEARRNTFWICYADERINARLPGHAMGVDDSDVTQALPLAGNAFDQHDVSQHSQRQFAHSPNVLLHHPTDLTDSFVLFVKSAILISRVRSFNRRFRRLNSLGVTGMHIPNSSARKFSEGQNSTSKSAEVSSSGRTVDDARDVDSFIALEIDVEMFTQSFPPGLQEPIAQDGSIDWLLLNAFLVSEYAKMTLHEPHADLRLNTQKSDVNDFACKSARKVVEALDNAYHLCRTMAGSISDITLCDPYCSSILFQCAAISVEIIQKSLINPPSSEEDIMSRPRCGKYWEKVKFVRSTLQKIGVRLPQAEVLDLLLNDLVQRLMDPKRRSSSVSID